MTMSTLPNQLRAISTSQTTTWQFAVFPYIKETQKAVIDLEQRSFNSVPLTLTESMNASRSINLLIHSDHTFPQMTLVVMC